jgi:hypothetical protein
MSIKQILLLLVCNFFSFANLHAEELPASVIEECTTNEKIYYPTLIRVNSNITDEQKASAIMESLSGPWIYENESEVAIYAGYHVRTHYLKFAIVFNEKGLITIICDSSNMKQKEDSIHRKAPQWKESLNTRIRARIADIVIALKSGEIHLKNLSDLYANGFVTKEEFEKIKNRINAE